MKIPFMGGAYSGRALSVNAERCVNFYLEKQGEDWILVGTPGLTLRVEVLQGPIRGMHLFNGFIIAVAGPKVYSISSSHVASLVGTIGTSSGRVSMADNGQQVLIVDGSDRGFYYDGSFAEITDEDFNGGTTAASQDGYFIVTEPDTGRFRISDLYTAAIWIDSDFATAEGAPDNIRAVISDRLQLWLTGVETTEVWWESGDADFPFQRIQSGFMQNGIAAPFTLNRFDNTVTWLTSNERGEGLLGQATDDYSLKIISPIGINWHWSQYEMISDAFSFTYQVEGHEFNVITFPSADATWVVDAATQQWHQWSSNINSNPLSRHRANCHVFAFGRHYVGDYISGKIYTIEPNVYTENGETIIRDRIAQHINSEEGRIPIANAQIVFQPGEGLITGQGSDPMAMLRWSKDRGRTWSNEIWKAAGLIGEYLRRAIWRNPGGRPRNITWWLRVSAPIKWIVRNAFIKLRDEDKKDAN